MGPLLCREADDRRERHAPAREGVMAKNKYSAERFASWREIIRKTGVDEILGNDALRREVFDPPLSTAGKLLGLDAAKPDDAALMLRILAYTLFPPKQKPSGRPKYTKKWNSLKLLDLGFDRKEVKGICRG